MIRVIQGYRGALTNGAYIEPGVYQETDPALAGLAARLLAKGYAVRLEKEQPTDNNTTDNTRTSLEDMTVAELRELAAEKDIDLGEATRKADIIDVVWRGLQPTS